MFTIKTISTDGNIEWLSETAPEAVRTLETFWSIGADTFCGTEKHGSIFDSSTGKNFVSSLLHGRSCYLGQCPQEKRHYFAKGIGWTHVNGYAIENGLYGMLSSQEAQYDRQAAEYQNSISINVIRPEAIFLHRDIPGRDGHVILASQFDDDPLLAKPCMYVYSSPSRWRIADLQFLYDSERAVIFQPNPKEYLRNLLNVLGQSVRMLHATGGHNWTLSSHNAFVDGTRVDFEYVKLPNVPHKDRATENETAVNKSKEMDGLREIALFLAELLRLNINGKKLYRWCDL